MLPFLESILDLYPHNRLCATGNPDYDAGFLVTSVVAGNFVQNNFISCLVLKSIVS
jgi:hypothetical protein